MNTFVEFLKKHRVEVVEVNNYFITFKNSNDASFTLSLNDCYTSLKKLHDIPPAISSWVYEEKPFREAIARVIAPKTSNPVADLLPSQTAPTVRILSLYACYLTGKTPSAALIDFEGSLAGTAIPLDKASLMPIFATPSNFIEDFKKELTKNGYEFN